MADNTPTVSTEVGTGREAVATDEIAGKHHQKVKLEFGGDDVATQVSTLDPLPVEETSPLDLSGLATQATLAAVLTELGQKLEAGGEVALSPTTLAALETITVANPTADPETGLATQTTLAAVLAKIISAPATEAKQDTLNGKDFSTEATQAKRYGGGKTPIVATVTASGDTIIHTPAAGMKIRVYWLSAINDPDEASSPLIRISLGSTELYRVYAVAHWEPFEGAVDEPLIANLSGPGNVAMTVHLLEV